MDSGPAATVAAAHHNTKRMEPVVQPEAWPQGGFMQAADRASADETGTDMHGWFLAHVLSFLGLEDLATCSSCCQDWNRMIHGDDTVWRLVAQHVWGPELLQVDPQLANAASDAHEMDAETAIQEGGDPMDIPEDDNPEAPQPYGSFRELVLDRNARFAVPCLHLGLHMHHAARSMSSPRSRQYKCDLGELIWNKAADEISLLFEVDGDPAKVRMPVSTFLFRRILDEGGNKYDDITVSPPCTTSYAGEQGSYRGMILWKAEDIFAANRDLEARCQGSHLIAKVPPERVSGVRLSLCFGLPCQGPVAVVGAMMDQSDACRPLDRVLAAASQSDLDNVFLSSLTDGISYKSRAMPLYQ